MTRRIPVRLLLPLLAVVLVAAAWFVPEPASPVVDGGRSAVEVRQTVWACPVRSGWSVAAGQVGPGTEAAARAIPEEAAVDPAWADATRWRTAEPGGDALVLEQSGEGSGSVGFVAGEIGDASVLGSCPSVVDDAWFTGLADGGRTDSVITLVNVGENRAVADLTWWGSNGPIQSLDTSGLVVEPGERREVKVDDVAAGEGAVSVHVSRRRGALTAIATDAGAGRADLVAPSRGPVRSQVLAGLPPGDSTRLALANPGTATAHVAVAVRGESGSFAAEGLEDVTVEPESTRVIDVPGSIELDGASLAVTSDLPVVASATVADGDIARVVRSAEITGPAIAPVRMDGLPVRLALTAGDEAAEVTVESFSVRMDPLGSEKVTLKPGTSRSLPAPKDRFAAYVVVTPAEGDSVMGGLWRTAGEGLAAAPLRPAPVTVVAPGVSVR